MISVIIPAFNEEGAVGETVRAVYAVLRDLGDCEVIVVDDGSVDRTSEEAERGGARIIRHPTNAGYGRSLKDGISIARFDNIVITDADGTYPLDAIPQLVREYEKGFDMVVAAREGKHYEESFLKSVLRRLLQFLVEFTTGSRIPDINSGMRIFSKKTILQYLSRLCDTFSFTTSLTLAYMMTGRFVCHVPIRYEKRIGASKVRLWRDALRTLQFIIEAVVLYNPMKIFLLLSGLLCVGAACSLAFAFVSRILAAYIFAIAFVLLAILMFGLGLLSVLLKYALRHPSGASDNLLS